MLVKHLADTVGSGSAGSQRQQRGFCALGVAHLLQEKPTEGEIIVPMLPCCVCHLGLSGKAQ